MSVFGAIAWFFTRNNSLLRLGLLGLLIAVRLSSSVKGSWIAEIWSASPIPWLFQFDYWKYLFIVIPGTIAGDCILSWLRDSKNEDKEVIKSNWNQPQYCSGKQKLETRFLKETGFLTPQLLSTNTYWNHPRLGSIIFLMLAICLELLIGLQARLVWQTTLLSLVFCSVGWFLLINPRNQTERLLQLFYHWGIYWLAIGLLFEPFEKGIKKDPSTLSYYFVTTAIALFLLIAFTIVLDIFPQSKSLQILIDNGQNPMIAYVAFANLLWPILKLTNIEPFILYLTSTPFMGFLKGVFYTLIIAGFVSICTKFKILWRT
jgi:hypothetical protein